MRIFVLGTRGFPNVQGGVEKHCEQLYPRLVELGCDVTVATRAPYIPRGERVRRWNGVRLIHLWALKNKYLEAFIHTLVGVIVARFYSPDIVHFHSIGPSLLTPLAKMLGLKVVVTNHGPDYLRLKWGKHARAALALGEALAIRFADKMIVISGTTRSMLAGKYGRADLEFIPNGVNFPEIVPPGDILKKFNLQPGKYVFAACRFVPEKGLHDLIAAYQKIGNPQFQLVIAGDADHKDEYSRTIKNAAARDKRIVLTGFLSGRSLGELFSNTGLFVLPSYYEGLPIALLEAISYKLPVLVSDIPANKELPLPRFRYFRAGNVDRLSRQMVELLQRGISESEKREQRKIFEQQYQWDKIAERTLKVYEKVLRKE